MSGPDLKAGDAELNVVLRIKKKSGKVSRVTLKGTVKQKEQDHGGNAPHNDSR